MNKLAKFIGIFSGLTPRAKDRLPDQPSVPSIVLPRYRHDRFCIRYTLPHPGHRGNSIPRNFYFFWSGHDFQYVHYLAVLSLLKTNQPNLIEIHCEHTPKNNPHWQALAKLDRVSLVRVDFARLLSGAGIAKRSSRAFFKIAKIVHRSDLFRYLILYRHGGVYLDFDTFSVRNLDPLLSQPFFAGYQFPAGAGVAKEAINGAVLGSLPGASVLKTAIETILDPGFLSSGLHWARTGPELLSNLLCGEGDFTLLPFTYFYPYPWSNWEAIFNDGSIPRETRIVHYWGSQSWRVTKPIDRKALLESDTLFARLAREVCL